LQQQYASERFHPPFAEVEQFIVDESPPDRPDFTCRDQAAYRLKQGFTSAATTSKE
jgi:hypothetical protein